VRGRKLRNDYGTRFEDAWNVARHVASHLDRLERGTRSFPAGARARNAARPRPRRRVEPDAGQWLATVVNLGHVLPAEHVRETLRSIYTHNFRHDLGWGTFSQTAQPAASTARVEMVWGVLELKAFGFAPGSASAGARASAGVNGAAASAHLDEAGTVIFDEIVRLKAGDRLEVKLTPGSM
jgi:hypothetical protein